MVENEFKKTDQQKRQKRFSIAIRLIDSIVGAYLPIRNGNVSGFTMLVRPNENSFGWACYLVSYLWFVRQLTSSQSLAALAGWWPASGQRAAGGRSTSHLSQRGVARRLRLAEVQPYERFSSLVSAFSALYFCRSTYQQFMEARYHARIGYRLRKFE